MYLDFLVKIPHAPGKLGHVKKGKTTYIDYEYDRIYDREKKYTAPKKINNRKAFESESNSDTAKIIRCKIDTCLKCKFRPNGALFLKRAVSPFHYNGVYNGALP